MERKVFGTPESKNEAVKEIIQDLSFWTTHIKLNFRYMTDQLMFEDISMTLQKQCCHLHTLIFCDTELSVNLQSIINLCAHFLQNVRVLVLRNSKFGSNPVNGEYNEISKLEVLDVRRCFPASGNRPLFSIMPHLKKLCLADVVQIDDFWFEDDFSFLSQLEVLDLGNTMIHIDTFLALQARALNLIELYLCRTIIWNAALMEFVFPKLKTICLNFCYYVNYEGIVSIIESCPSLQNIYVKEKVAESYAKCDFVDQNESKLEVVKVANSDNHFMLKDYLYG